MPVLSDSGAEPFFFALLGSTVLSFSEVAIASALAGIVQSIFAAKRRPSLTQVCFNASNLALSSCAGLLIIQRWIPGLAEQPLTILLILGSSIVYFVNTALVAVVLTLVEKGSLAEVWKNWCLGSLPYYIVGAMIVAGAISAQNRVSAVAAILLAPSILLRRYTTASGYARPPSNKFNHNRCPMVYRLRQLNSNASSSEPALESGSRGDGQTLTTTVQDAFKALARGGESRERRRRSPRYPSSAAIRLAWTSNFDKYAMGVCVDISLGGLGMLIFDPIPVHTKVCFKSEIRSLALNGSGTVRHCKKQKAKYIIGVDFGGGLKWLGTGQHITALHERRTVTGNAGIEVMKK